MEHTAGSVKPIIVIVQRKENNMGKLIKISMIIIVVILLSCSDRNPTNPFDPEVGTEFPPVTLNSVEVVDIAKLQVSWSSSYEYYTFFKIERSSTDQSSGFNVIAEISQGTFVYADTLVNAETTYYYRIQGMVDELSAPYSNTLSGSLSLQAPLLSSIAALNDNQLKLIWNWPAVRSFNINREIEKQSNKESTRLDFGFAIERKNEDEEFTEVARVDSDTFMFIDSGLSTETLYSYRLRTYLNQSYSLYSITTSFQTISLQAPSNLTAEPLSDQEVELNWQDNCSFESGFSIERKEDQGEFTIIGEVDEDSTTFTNEGLLLSVNYTYRVRAITDYNVSNYSNEAGTSTFFPAPFNLTTQAISDQNIILEWEYDIPEGKDFIKVKDNNDTYKKVTWGDSRFQQGFSILRREEAGDFTEIGTTSADELTFTDQGLLFGVNYQYYVRAFTDLNYSDGSNMVWEQTIFPAPDGLSGVTSIDNAIGLTWNDNCTFEENYYIERSIEWSPYEVIAVLDADVTYFTDTNLEHGPLHIYRVRAGTSINYSEYSAIDTTITYFPPPTDLTTEATSYESIELEWNDNCSFEDGYSVQINDGSGYVEIVFTTNNTCNILGLEYGLQYSFSVRAKHGINYSLPIYADEIIELVAPENLTINAEDDQTLHIQWTAIDSFEDGFSVERSINGSAFEEIVVTAFDVYQYWDNGLIYGNNYTYRVRSFSNEFNSPYSSEATSTTYFPAPTNLESELLSDTAIELSWLDNGNFETGYAIERRDAGSSFVEIAQVVTNNVSYTDSDLVYGLHYYYRVRAITDINFSDYTNEDDTLVEITAPTNLLASTNVTEILLEWNDNTDIEESYEVERKIDGEDFIAIATVNQDVTNYTDTNVANMVTYFYRVRAITQNNQSEYSNITNATLSNTMLLVPYFYPTIQDAINEATENDTILIYPGTYNENIHIYSTNLTVGSLFLTTQDVSYISQTIIEGYQFGSVVYFGPGADETTLLCGLTVTNGVSEKGGGISTFRSSPRLSYLNIVGNSATFGGAISCSRDAETQLSYVNIENNVANEKGGGIYIDRDSDVQLDFVTINNNTADFGGGIYNSYPSRVEIHNSIISGNTANSGGGLFLGANNGIYNTIISGNVAQNGAGLYIDLGSHINNSIIISNSATSSGGAIYSSGYTYMINSIIWDNLPEAIYYSGGFDLKLYCDIQDDVSGYMSSDPLFVSPLDPNNAPSTAGDFHLSPDSPCIDTGDPDAQYNDPDGTRNDIGAYGGQGGGW
jgi:hypothetical protein